MNSGLPKLPLLYDALMSHLENGRQSGDGSQLQFRCPFCGGSKDDPSSFSIRANPDKEGEPVVFICFRATCGRKGMLTTEILDEIGIQDKAVHRELYEWNLKVNPNSEKRFISRSRRDYVLCNIPSGNGRAKLAYVNNRLGLDLRIEQLKDLKIQLSLKDMLRANDIQRIAVSKGKLNRLDIDCVGFVSMFEDYLICRDITPDQDTGYRYYIYQIAGKPDKDNLKIYCMPRDINLLDPQSAIINVAEGPFSILGAYFNTPIGKEKPNNVWLANCGSQYENTILRVCKQYGLLRIHLNIWSDSEIPFSAYKKLYSSLRNRLDIRKMTVYYNQKKEDFGYSRHDIQISKATII